MSLKDAINNTNTQKENIKTVAKNIDNKLVELGGEQAIDLVDVPNKIEKTIRDNYIQVAKNNGFIKKTYTQGEAGAPEEGTKTYSFEFDIKNDLLINFTPKSLKARVYVSFWEKYYGSGGENVYEYLENIELININKRYYVNKTSSRPDINSHDGWVDIKNEGNKIIFTITHHLKELGYEYGFSKESFVKIGPYEASTGPATIIG